MVTANSTSGRGFEQYTGEVYGWAYRLLGRHHDALDVVQDVFLKWARQCDKGQPGQPRGWLRSVTLNQAIDFIRRRRTAEEAAAQQVPAATAADLAGENIDRAALREDIVRALDELSESQRSVLVAKVYDELTFARIAAELDLAVSTVKTHYLRAIRVVRDILQRRWAQE